MKRKILVILMMICLCASCILTGCGGSDTQGDGSSGTEAAAADDTAAADDQTDQTGAVSADSEPIDISALGGEGGVDVDLTVLSTTMIYSVVNDMLTRPNEYLGKTVRMKGAMATYHDEETDKTYYACIIQDATACCSQGIEFVTTDEFKPEDYPADGEEVTVMGTYDLYEEGGYQYCVLKDAVLE